MLGRRVFYIETQCIPLHYGGMRGVRKTGAGTYFDLFVGRTRKYHGQYSPFDAQGNCRVVDR